MAKQILSKYSKKRLLKLTYNDLSKVKGIGPAKSCTILAATELVKWALKIGENTLPIIRSTKDVIAQSVYLRDKAREHLMVTYDKLKYEWIKINLKLWN